MGPDLEPEPFGRASSDFAGPPLPSRPSLPSRGPPPPPPLPPRRRGRRFGGRCENRKSSDGSLMRALELGGKDSSSKAAAAFSCESSLEISSDETISGSL